MSEQPDAVVTCPACSADTVNLLEYSSSVALVWYLRCRACGHVWTLEKSAYGRPPTLRQTITEHDVRLQRLLRESSEEPARSLDPNPLDRTRRTRAGLLPCP